MMLFLPRNNYCSTTTTTTTTTTAALHLVFLVCLVAGVLPGANAGASARLRGKHFDALEERVRNPTIDESLRGKTLKELGMLPLETEQEQRRRAGSSNDAATSGGSSSSSSSAGSSNNYRNERQLQQQQQRQRQRQLQQQARRKTQEQETIQFFSVYDEYGPSFVKNMGDTVGLRGMIYDTQAKDDGLVEQFVRGALQGTCAVVASDGKQLCSYEIFVVNGADKSTTKDGGKKETIGTVVATGSVMMELGTKNILIIEATGDDFIKYKGGMVSITYTAIGDQTVMDLDLTFRR